MTQIELATTMSIDRTAMVYLLDELEQQGLVERVRHPQDRRAFQIHLTADGQDAQRKAAAALAGAADTLLTPLDATERHHLVDLLAKVAEHWQQEAAPHKPATPRRTRLCLRHLLKRPAGTFNVGHAGCRTSVGRARRDQ
jgi:predicted ArsR family transcriptional regulator